MGATYDEAAPGVPLNYIRRRLGDTDVSVPLLSDEHIIAVLDEANSKEAALVELADELIARYGKEPDSVTLPSGLKVSYKDRITVWARIVTRQETQSAAAAVVEQVAVPTMATAIQAVW